MSKSFGTIITCIPHVRCGFKVYREACVRVVIVVSTVIPSFVTPIPRRITGILVNAIYVNADVLIVRIQVARQYLELKIIPT